MDIGDVLALTFGLTIDLSILASVGLAIYFGYRYIKDLYGD